MNALLLLFLRLLFRSSCRTKVEESQSWWCPFSRGLFIVCFVMSAGWLVRFFCRRCTTWYCRCPDWPSYSYKMAKALGSDTSRITSEFIPRWTSVFWCCFPPLSPSLSLSLFLSLFLLLFLLLFLPLHPSFFNSVVSVCLFICRVFSPFFYFVLFSFWVFEVSWAGLGIASCQVVCF